MLLVSHKWFWEDTLMSSDGHGGGYRPLTTPVWRQPSAFHTLSLPCFIGCVLLFDSLSFILPSSSFLFVLFSVLIFHFFWFFDHSFRYWLHWSPSPLDSSAGMCDHFANVLHCQGWLLLCSTQTHLSSGLSRLSAWKPVFHLFRPKRLGSPLTSLFLSDSMCSLFANLMGPIFKTSAESNPFLAQLSPWSKSLSWIIKIGFKLASPLLSFPLWTVLITTADWSDHVTLLRTLLVPHFTHKRGFFFFF